MISRVHQLVFVHVPKCAGMAVEAALGGLPDAQRTEQHLTGHQYARYHPEAWSRFHRFTVVRDPRARCVSYVRFYRRWDAVWRRHLGHVADSVLLRDLLMSSSHLANLRPHRMLTGDEEVLRVEELDVSWPAFADRHRLPAVLVARNASPKVAHAAELSVADELFVAARCPEDFTRFGYALPTHDPTTLSLEDQGAILWARLRWMAEAFAHRELDEDGFRAALGDWVAALPLDDWRRSWSHAVERLPLRLGRDVNPVSWTERVHEEIHRAHGLALWKPWSPEG
ncbi:MAG: hypothetical protein H6738_12770 [Alphaproteobacteria bacterium]|nr:hypothetical protein [Alphaproteobacteria bacterium]MCB9697647.1 hypothetical protein [Alphaproteobacteria bacterium]